MFIGYQNNIVTFIANTREELENIPCVSFDKIEEVAFAEMFNGVIYTSEEELLQAQTKAVEETRAGLYAAKVDPITAHINRLRDEELTPEIAAEIAKLVEERKQLVEEIKAQHPYVSEVSFD
jgi:formiminotetrahydrofolate cyclodeaminase